MAIVLCYECGTKVSDQAYACPRCGAPFRAVETRAAPRSSGCCGVAALLSLVVLLALGVLFKRAAEDVVRVQRVAKERAAKAAVGVTGLDAGSRREIYNAYWNAGMDASEEAARQYPLHAVTAGAMAEQMKERKAVYDAVKAAGRERVLSTYGIDAAQLDAVDSEGQFGRWPLTRTPRRP